MRKALSRFLALGSFAACLSVVAGCSEAREPARAHLQSPLTVPVPGLNQFLVLGRRSITVGDRSSLSGGDIGVSANGNIAANSFSAGIDSRVGIGEVIVAPRVVLRERVIAGEIGATQIDAPSATTGPRSAFVAPPVPPVPGAVAAGSTAVNVNVGQTSTLASGRFGPVTVSGTLNLGGGLFELQSLRLSPDARVIALASSIVRISGGLSAADRSRLVPASSLAPSSLRVVVAGNIDANNNSVLLSTDVQLGGLIVARNTFRAGERLTATGSITALDVVLGNDARLSFASGFDCSSNAACDDANPCTVDACVDAQCVRSPAANGTACNDGNACTQTDACQAGACAGTNPRACAAADQCHDAGTCNPATGACSNPEKPNGASCDDANACTRSDSCQGGACTGGDPVACVAVDQCHDAGTCNPANGLCSTPAKADGSGCSDGDACTRTDTCRAGACVGADSVVCAALDECHAPGSCDPSSGACSTPARPDGAACSDGSACTRVDSCRAGTCVGDAPVVCAAMDECHEDGVCDPASGACSTPAKPDGTRCDDGDVCSHADRCQAGACAAGTDYAVTEFASGLARPGWIIAGPLDSLWFVSAESSFGANDGSIAQITTDGVVTRTAVFRSLYGLLHGPDGLLWVADSVPGGLPTVGRFSPATRAFISDVIGVQAQDLTSSNDGGTPIIWYTGGSGVGRMTADGALLPPVRSFNATRAITAARPAPNTTIWFTQANTGTGRAFIGRIQYPNLTQFPIDTDGELADIVEGADRGIWFTDPARNSVARLAPSGGALVRYALPTGASYPYGIAAAPDGSVWATLRAANKIARVSPDGTIAEVCLPTADSQPTHIAVGQDGNIWFTEASSGNIGRIRLAP